MAVSIYALSAQSAHAQTICKAKRPAKIKINPVTKKLRYDFSKPLSAMQVKADNNHNPYGAHAKTVTQGFMMGDIRMVPTVKISGFENSRTGATCLWYDEIKIDVEINPSIHIGKEIYNDPCLRQSVLDHEHKHVIVDRKVVNQFSKNIGYRLKRELQQEGSSIGFFPRSQKSAMIDRMQQMVQTSAREEFEKLNTIRRDAQSKIDTREEYERVAAQCPAAQGRLLKNDHYRAIAR